jgi:hypothetical protein
MTLWPIQSRLMIASEDRHATQGKMDSSDNTVKLGARPEGDPSQGPGGGVGPPGVDPAASGVSQVPDTHRTRFQIFSRQIWTR